MNKIESEVLQAFTDGLSALAIAISRQLHGGELIKDLRMLAEHANEQGAPHSSAVIGEVAMSVEEALAQVPEAPTYLESLSQGTEDALAVMAGTIAEATEPELALRSMLGAQELQAAARGPSSAGSALLRSSLRLLAIKARTTRDPALQAEIARLLGGDSTNRR